MRILISNDERKFQSIHAILPLSLTLLLATSMSFNSSSASFDSRATCTIHAVNASIALCHRLREGVSLVKYKLNPSKHS